MSGDGKTKKFDWFTFIVFIGLLGAGLHYFFTGVFFKAADLSCKQSSYRYNPVACECRLSKYRASPLLEHFLLGRSGNRASERKARKIMYDVMAACPNPK